MLFIAYLYFKFIAEIHLGPGRTITKEFPTKVPLGFGWTYLQVPYQGPSQSWSNINQRVSCQDSPLFFLKFISSSLPRSILVLAKHESESSLPWLPLVLVGLNFKFLVEIHLGPSETLIKELPTKIHLGLVWNLINKFPVKIHLDSGQTLIKQFPIEIHLGPS